ncbi:CARDB domain-containing protein [Haloarcula argentinensis]|nr:cell surface glycoprotein-like protein [Haloarcula argentinensis DSM 12282]
MTLLMVVAVSTTPMFGPGVAAASNHETGTIGESDIRATDAGLIDERVNTAEMQTPQPEVWVTFENTGGTAGTVPITVEVGGREVTVIGPDEATVAPDESSNVTTAYVLETSDGGYIENGEHEVTVNGEPAGTLVVGEPNITVTDHSWNTTTVSEGGAVELTVSAENTGTVSGQRDIFTIVDGKSDGGVSFNLKPDESGTKKYVHTFDEAGAFEFGTAGETQTITVGEPPSFAVTERKLNRSTVNVGEAVEITATVTNTGDREGSFEVPFTVDGKTEVTREVTLDGGDSTTVSYIRSFDESGNRSISINGAAARSLTVEAENGGGAGPPNIKVRDAGLIDERVNTAEMQTPQPEVWVTFENTGGTTGTVPITVEVGGREVTVISSTEVTVEPGERNVTTTYVLETDDGGYIDDGEHDVTVNGDSAGTLVVGKPNITVTDHSWNRTTVTEGGAVELIVTAENTGAVSGQRDIFTYVDDRSVDAVSFSLGPGESGTDTYVHTFEQTGTRQFSVGDASKTITVEGENETEAATDEDGTGTETATDEQSARFEVRDAKLSNQSVETGDSVDVTATVENVGTESGNYTAALTESNQTLKSKTIGPIAGGETVTVTFSISFDNEGNRSLAIGNAATETLAVEAESSNDGGGGGSGGGGDGGGGGGGGGGGFDFDDDSDETDNGGGAEAPAISQSQIDNGITVQVTADAANSMVTQSLNRSGPSETAPAFTLSALSLNVTNESDGFNATMLGPHATPNDMTEVQEDGVRGYVTVTSGANASDISRATYTLRLNESALPTNGSMDSVRVFQYHNGSWSQLPSTANATNKSIQASSSNLSTIAVVSPVANASTPTTTASPSNTNASTPMPAELTVSNASLMADWVRTGFNTSARAAVENPTDETVEQTLTVTVDGDPVASRTVRLNAGEQTTVTMEFKAVDGAVAVNGVSAGDLRVGSDTAQSTGGSGTDETGEGGGAEPAAKTVAASGPGFTVQLVAIVVALLAGIARLRRRV